MIKHIGETKGTTPSIPIHDERGMFVSEEDSDVILPLHREEGAYILVQLRTYSRQDSARTSVGDKTTSGIRMDHIGRHLAARRCKLRRTANIPDRMNHNTIS